jgi:CSLREA domain-containing protein
MESQEPSKPAGSKEGGRAPLRSDARQQPAVNAGRRVHRAFARCICALLLASLLLVGQSAPPVYAAAYVVNSLADTIASDSACTLREAIQEANNGAETDCPGSPSNANDTITFGVSGTIRLTSTLPNIVSGQGTLTIDGSRQNVTISGNNAVRVMWVNAGANLTLRNLTIANGKLTGASGAGVTNFGTLTVINSTFSGNSASSGGGIVNLSSGVMTVSNSTFSGNSTTGSGNGGGILSNGTLTVNNSTFSNNSATDSGGGIDNYGGTLTVNNSTFSGNSATVSGGGIENYDGTLTVSNSTFSGNSANYGGGGIDNYGGTLTVSNSTISNNSATGIGGGGGILNNGTLTVNNSTFSGNSATVSGGGIENYDGTLTVSNSTFSGNSANYGGGGIDNYGGTLTVSNSTISNNSATGIGGGGGILNNGTLTVNNSTFSGNSATVSGGGGGIRINGGSATIRNTIIANSENGGECVGTLSGTNNNNLIDDNVNACGLTNGMNGNIIAANPNLGALTGSPAYFPLTAGSLALNAGDNATCAATDQRGVFRPQGGQCDIGAFEMSVVSLPLVVR